MNNYSDKTKGKVVYSSYATIISELSELFYSTKESYPWINFNLL